MYKRQLVGVVVFICAIIVTVLGFKRMIKVRTKTNTFTDARVTLMREISNSIKMIKYYAWEDAYEKKAYDIRTEEVKHVWIMQITRNIMTSLSLLVPNLSSMATFLAMYKVESGSKTPGSIFSSLSLFQVLSMQMFFLPMAFSTGVDGLVAISRVQEFLESSEENREGVDSDGFVRSNEVALDVINASFEWEIFKSEDSKTNERTSFDPKNSGRVSLPFFKNLNFQIQKGELVIITGSIGTGKSSLLNALAGFMKKTEGDIFKNGSLLLCGYPWIQNTTVRDNILFGSSFDDVRSVSYTHLDVYKRQRINLARSVYKSMDIYLFDDVLSAVDARVGKHIMDECLMGMLDGKTRILATHQLSLIERASRVIFLGAGGSFDIGTVEELKERNSGFVKLMEFSTQTKSANQREEVDDHAEENLGQNCQQEIAKLEKQISKKSNSEKTTTDGRLISKEERAVNSINLKIYKEYIAVSYTHLDVYKRQQ